MSVQRYPIPQSQRTFNFGAITIDSNFDSGNCSQAQKLSNTSVNNLKHRQYEIWIGSDNPKNNYRTWFHFSTQGFNSGTCVSFKIKNMQNQFKLLSEGLLPVFREDSGTEWRRIKEKINIGAIEFNEGWIQWTFKHTFTSSQKVFFALFYPWSNLDNHQFLNNIANQVKSNPNIYFYRQPITYSLEGRNLDVVVISSNVGKTGREQKFQDSSLFENVKKPMAFNEGKKGIVLSARVHPGEVPGSHVLNGIIQEVISDSETGRLLRENFVFYIFPILNPDGVARGHYRVDTNGVNLNRCYINPTLKNHPTIYAIKSLIMHLHSKNRFFCFLDLHAHASRKGTFIYGNSLNELQKQVDTCIFPKILSLNSADFQYEGSDFTEQNMYCKDRGDHISKEGSGRVAMYKATKNAYCWTLECNYNMSRVNNILEGRRKQDIKVEAINEKQLNEKVILNYRQPAQKEATEFFTIETYHKLGRQICESFLDLIERNPSSRIDNPLNYFKSVPNLRLNLAVALLRMAPNRFEPHFRKIHTSINSETAEFVTRALQALYYLMIKNAKINNISSYIKDGDQSAIVVESPKKTKSTSFSNPSVGSCLLDRIAPKKIRRNKQENDNDWKSERNVEKRSVDISEFRLSNKDANGNNFQVLLNFQVDEQSPKDRIETMIRFKLRIYEQEMRSHRATGFRPQAQPPKMMGLINWRQEVSHKRALSPTKTTKIRIQEAELPSLGRKISLISPERKKSMKVETVRDYLYFVEGD